MLLGRVWQGVNNNVIFIPLVVLNCNSFEFNGSHFKQVHGIAMGTKAAPSTANLVMGHLKITNVYKYPKQPLLWLRFIDDIFMIWTHGPNELKKFIDHLNQAHPTLKFTFESSPTQVSFLDTWVKMEDNFLYTDLFVKPTDTHMYLLYSSCHPKQSKSGGPYSQLLRVKRICSRLSDFKTHAISIIQHYSERGYPLPLLQEKLDQVLQKDRHSLLHCPTPLSATPQVEQDLFCVVTYHPVTQPSWIFSKIIRKY